PTRRTNSPTGGMSSSPEAVLAIRATTGPPTGPPALSPPAVAPQPAVAAVRASAIRAPALPHFISGSRQGDAQLEDGSVRSEGEHLAVRAENGRPEQGVRRTRPPRDQPVRPVVNQRWPRPATGHVGVASGIDRRLAHVPVR